MIKWLLAEPPNVGEKWRDRNYKNPFTDEGIVVVIEVTDGWVKHCAPKWLEKTEHELTYHQPFSYDPIRVFRAGYRLWEK